MSLVLKRIFIFAQKANTFKPGMGKILPEILSLPEKMMLMGKILPEILSLPDMMIKGCCSPREMSSLNLIWRLRCLVYVFQV